MTKTIKDFIDLNWHTVPLGGKLERLSNGKKTTPVYETGWLAKYTAEYNQKDSKLGGVITGKVSGIIAIDCDNTTTYETFKALDPDYGFVFVSVGKKDALGNDIKSGTFIYKYVEELSDSYIVHNQFMSLDFLSTGKFTYLPTSANTTKKEFSIVDKKLKEPSANIIALIKSLKPIKVEREVAKLEKKVWQNHLAPQVSRFCKTQKVTKELFRVITPHDFRNLPEYENKGFVHPDDVPEGRGSEYMMKVSGIFGADESIDEELYMAAMQTINDCFSDPLKKSRLQGTIIDPMVEERSSVNGKPIWQYNKDWAENKLQVITKRNAMLDAFYDPDRMIYYLADVVSESVKRFSRDNDFQSYIEAVGIEPPPKKEVKTQLPLVDVISSPAHDFGFFSGDSSDQAFNIFSPTKALRVFRHPDMYKDHYSRPTTTLQFLETLVPDNIMRNYLLRFLRRKLDTFEYSPTILYFLGKSGAGKDRFVHIIEQLVGMNTIARPTTGEFLEIYNGWLLDTYFAQLDEYGNQLSRHSDKDSALGKLKAYTGKPEVSIRTMRNDGMLYYHSVTFIMTANKNPLFIDADDRRMCLFNCSNKMADASWVQQFGGVANVLEQIDTEILDFAYYLSTEVENLTRDEYNEPPQTDDKKKLIASMFSAGERIAFLLTNKMFVELEELAREFEAYNLFDGSEQGRLYEEELFDLYFAITEGNGTRRGLNNAMKEFDKIPTTRDGKKSYYYHVALLRGYKPAPFSPIENADTDTIEGI